MSEARLPSRYMGMAGEASPPAPMERSAPPAGGGDDGSGVYGAYIQDQVARQDQRKQSLEARGIAVITTAGAIAALLVGFTALTTKSSATFSIPSNAEFSLRIAMVLFAAAALLALVTNAPLRYREPLVEEMRQVVKTRWEEPAEDARRRVSLTLLTTIESAKRQNRIKVFALFWALVAEVLALAATAVAVWIIL